ncbi:Dynamin central region-domain-containing protein [Scheffersomyces coipomensis]|uniref:Dynamin central region-domain-containing protein n=1 Tax=Scheffersomyces coipomensis TaxID=1788519 RepID=UPI00315DFFD7
MSFHDLIPVVNKLQDIVTTTQLSDLDLPILAVVGSQSCGKSSVLENIVGKDFLPRGTGIVTRRPLVLQLNHVKYDDPIISNGSNDYQPQSSPFSYSSSTDNDEEGEVNLEDHLRKHANGGKYQPPSEWGEFLHIPNKRYYNFNDIRKEIENETLRIAGTNKGISRLPINLKIFSPNVLDLTLVDLPGLTKIPIGDQPTDIERQTRNLILEYISKPNCIILAVSPANVDLVNSESLKLARQVDPTGKRTVGILTKLDLMDQGTNALDILKGNVYPLKLGFIGIVNRSQQDISENKALTDSLYDEQQFFRNHQAYKALSNKCGTKFLSQTLNKILMNHIRDRLPDIKAKLNTLMGQTEQELLSYGEIPSNLTNSPESRGGLILTLMTKFANSFVNSIEGTSLSEISTKELCGGARIYYIFNEIFGAQLAAINPTHNLSIYDIRTAIRNSTGPRPALFVPELAFDLLVKPQIQLLEDPSRRCVEMVYEELMKIVHNVCSSNIGLELNRYPRLEAKLIEVVSDLLRERLGPTIKYVESIIEIHRAYINTNHPNFVGAARAMSLIVEQRQKQKELESRNKLKLASERILNSKIIREEGSNGEDDDDEIADDEEDINSVDDVIKQPKPIKSGSSHKRSDSSKTNFSIKSESTPSNLNGNAYPESFFNYFFGKDPIIHQQHLQHQAQLNPVPFKFPIHQENTLQFINNNSNNTNVHSTNSSSNTISSHNLTEQQFKHLNLSDPSQDDSTSFESDDAINELSEREQLECELIRRLIVSYFGIVREMIQDQIPKSIMCLLVNYIKQHIQNRLVVKLYNDALFDELLQEDENIQAEREKCMELLNTYREASRVISEVI